MLIYSSKKDTIINTKNVIGFEIYVSSVPIYTAFAPPPDTTPDYSIRAIYERRDVNIGTYETYSRAKEILKQLFYKYNEELNTKQETTFEMPEE